MSKLAWGARLVVVVCGVIAIVGCGDDDGGAGTAGGPGAGQGGGDVDAATSGGGGPGATESGTFTAVIDGMAWEATPASIRTKIDEDVPGGYILEGTGGLSQHIQLNLFYVDAPGSYSLGVGGSVVGANGNLSRLGSIWQTPGSGAAGTLVITELLADRIVGNFELTAEPVPGSMATGTVMVTEGEFDLPLTEPAREIGPGHGRTLSAEIDGEPFNAATVVVTPLNGGISFNAINDAYNLGFLLSEVELTGTYGLSLDTPSRAVAAVAGSNGDMTTNCCWTVPLEEAGTITFSTISADRLVGTFEVTLEPQAGTAASAPLVVTSGVFDLGREDP
jgi:hypothetical protein